MSTSAVDEFSSHSDSEESQHNDVVSENAHGSPVSTGDANHKFLRSLPAEWSIVAMSMRLKEDVDTWSIDNLFNNFRVFEQDIKGGLKKTSSATNVAFVGQGKTSTNKVNTGGFNSGSYASSSRDS
ncbi:hypothetical protein CTI12_AA194400 [Artemisia annua]|uniref:Uncharacterized protein n=1 Tax=Artemisia annua TaxID=35608 RepID=A0A2U1P4F5_ARTAN|nr:hypothetical protein CTI12_AA194400 [Artemisia annua]